MQKRSWGKSDLSPEKFKKKAWYISITTPCQLYISICKAASLSAFLNITYLIPPV